MDLLRVYYTSLDTFGAVVWYLTVTSIPGLIMKGHFLSVYMLLEILQLNPKTFFEGKYELTEIGREITSRGTGPITQKQRKAMQNCRPVRFKGKDKARKKANE